MSNGISIKRGANINLRGEAEKFLTEAKSSKTFALKPDNFFGIIPRLLVKEGDLMDFERRILCYVPNKKLLTYFECKYLFINEVLEQDDVYINDNVLGKFYRKDFINETK